MSKILLCDFETTCLEAGKAEIIEIGAVVFDSGTFEILAKLDEFKQSSVTKHMRQCDGRPI